MKTARQAARERRHRRRLVLGTTLALTAAGVLAYLVMGAFPGRGMIDSYPVEWEDTLRKVIAMDWDRLIPGHPGAPDGRLGTKQDVKDQLALLQEASGEIQAAARDSKCWEPAEKEYKMPKYEKWPGYEVGLPMLVRRYCGLWGRGT